MFNFFFPRKCYKLRYNTFVEPTVGGGINMHCADTCMGKMYYDVFNYNLNERNVFGSSLLQQDIYGDCFIVVSWWWRNPEALRRYLAKIGPHPEIFLDPRLVVSSKQ